LLKVPKVTNPFFRTGASEICSTRGLVRDRELRASIVSSEEEKNEQLEGL